MTIKIAAGSRYGKRINKRFGKNEADKEVKERKNKSFLAAAVLSLGILSGCGAGSKEAKEARMTGIEQLNAGNYQDAIDSFGKALDESDGIVNSFELDVFKIPRRGQNTNWRIIRRQRRPMEFWRR